MKPIFIKTLIAIGALLLITAYGCGGTNLGGNTNLFFGTFEGSYNATGTPPTIGTVNPFSVDVNGNVAGTLTQQGSAVALATLSGIVTQTNTTTGSFSGTYTPQSGGTAVTVTNATFTWVTNGNTSTLNVTFTENTTTFSLILLPQPGSKARPH